jgi:RHH-type rel operon transcriptional repressor/antitoxin RelB
MLTVRLDNETEAFLQALSEQTQRPKSFFVKQALKNYQEDLTDLYDAQVRINAPDRNLISLNELEKALGL